jgi:hypothetical protein
MIVTCFPLWTAMQSIDRDANDGWVGVCKGRLDRNKP